jgi:hypothetical protein
VKKNILQITGISLVSLIGSNIMGKDKKSIEKGRGLLIICKILVLIGVVNFLAFAVISEFIGGDALRGKIVNGVFYLGNHGFFTEVSSTIYYFSLFHVYSLCVTFPMGVIAGIVYGGKSIACLTSGNSSQYAIRRCSQISLRHPVERKVANSNNQ